MRNFYPLSKWTAVFIIWLVSLPLAFPQEAAAPAGEGKTTSAPDGFRSIRLGMEMDTVKQKLKEDDAYDYRGDPDVSLLDQPQQSLIECRGYSYIQRAFFQFHASKLYIIILMLNQSRLDYYSVYTTLLEKYGEPSSLSPQEVIWDTEKVRFSLERPLTVKYIQKDTFDTLKEQGKAKAALRDISRDQFLDEF